MPFLSRTSLSVYLVILTFLLLPLVSTSVLAQADPELSLLSRFETNLFDEGAAEITAYDPATQRLFFVNALSNEVVVLDLSAPGAPAELGRIDMAPFGAEANSVAVSASGGATNVVAVAVENSTVTDPGTLVLFNSDLTVTPSTPLDASNSATVATGALPDGTAVSLDGTVVVVANEGEPEGADNPEGTVTVVAIDTPADVTAATLTTTQLDFGSVSLPADLRVIDDQATVQEEIEPEFATLSADGTTAYVTLQENNALAIVDVSTPTSPSIAQVLWLGTKDHTAMGNGLDVDNDDQINIAPFEGLQGLYQPDAIAAFEIMGTSYLATANEGDARNEDVDLDDLILEPAAFPTEGPFPSVGLEVSSVDGISATERGLNADIDAGQSTANPDSSPGEGRARLFVEQSGGTITRIQYEITIDGLDFSSFVSGAARTTDTGDDVIGLHVHNAARGNTGPIVFGIAGVDGDPFTPTETDDADLTITADGSEVTFRGSWDVAEGTDPNTFASGADGILGAAVGDDVALYVNVHTTNNQGGEIRGQLVAQPVYDALFSYGARSFTLWDASTGAVVFDSGDFFEEKTAELFPADFNATNDENDSFDSRSDNKGPEPEAITVATASDGNTYAFIGLERIGGVMVFDVSTPTSPVFLQYVNNRDFSVSDVQASVEGDGAVGDLGPESLVFIPAADNATTSDLLVVSNEVSGSVSIYTFGAPELAAWINEFHYDNDGADVQEFVEVVVDDNLTDLENLEVVLYNGSVQETYDVRPVSSFTVGDALPDFGFTIYWLDYTDAGGSIQNGSPDAIALCYRGQLASSGGAPVFLSYEGTFTAANGCAQGRTTSDVGVQEGSSTMAGTSVSLTNNGATYADLLAGGWEAGIDDTPGSLNTGQTALPVELAGFTASVGAEAVTLSWRTLSETNNAGFDVQRRVAASPEWTSLQRIRGAGTTTEARAYRFEDTDLPYAARSLVYRLRQVDADGVESFSEEIRVDRGAINQMELFGTYPNPVRDQATVQLAVPDGVASARLVLYDVLGRAVRTMTVESRGRQTMMLPTGNLASGVYFLRLFGEGEMKTQKLTIVH
jgi:hypothetical protein